MHTFLLKVAGTLFPGDTSGTETTTQTQLEIKVVNSPEEPDEEPEDRPDPGAQEEKSDINQQENDHKLLIAIAYNVRDMS